MTAAKGVRVLLWRHGRTAYNHAQRWQGQIDVPLDDVGRAQAAAGARSLAKLVEGVEVTIVASDLSRAAQTGGTLGALLGVPVATDPRLREIAAGEWEGLTRPEIVEAGMADVLAAWVRGDDVRIGRTGERRSEVGRRGAAAIAEHAAAVPDGSTLVVASHGGLVRGSTLTLLGLDPAGWNVLGTIGNCHWVDLHLRAGAWRLNGYNLSAPDAP